MEKYSLEKAQVEALEIQNRAKAIKGENAYLTNSDLTKAEESMTTEEEEKAYFDTENDSEFGAHTTSYLSFLEEKVTGEKAKDEYDNLYNEYPAEKNERLEEYFKGVLKNKKVLDLGCGIYANGYNISSHCEAFHYTGVEKFFAKTAYQEIKRISSTKPSIPFELVQEDMLEYLKVIKDKSNDVIFLSGIDVLIIHYEQWYELMKEIHRTLVDDGVLILGGGAQKNNDAINKYFQRSNELDLMFDDIVQKEFAPSIFRKKV
jgi:SAM-dependent methyltransferase